MLRRVLSLLLLALLLSCGERDAASSAESPAARDERAVAGLAEAHSGRRSGLWFETAGSVDRLLADDHDGSRHQRFILRLSSGQTLLVAHNIDLAPRIPVRPGDRLRFRGQYEWNDQGGVIHWTHHDPQRRQTGGWIEHEGRVYR
jgi:hypothetical protein